MKQIKELALGVTRCVCAMCQVSPGMCARCHQMCVLGMCVTRHVPGITRWACHTCVCVSYQACLRCHQVCVTKCVCARCHQMYVVRYACQVLPR